VRELTGKVHSLTVDLASEDVDDLKVKVHAATGAAPDAQCLNVEGGDGEPLDDGERKLGECAGLESGALVHMTMKDEEQAAARREQREAERAAWLAEVAEGTRGPRRRRQRGTTFDDRRSCAAALGGRPKLAVWLPLGGR